MRSTDENASIAFGLQQMAGGSSIADRLLSANMDVGVLRPWYDPQTRRSYWTRRDASGRQQTVVCNANTVLTKEAWMQLDTAIMKAALQRLRVVQDLRNAGLSFNLPNGLGTTVLEYQRMSDINDATVSMDGLRFGAADRPEFDLQYLPLPIIHKDFTFSARQIQASRNGMAPLDTTMGEQAARKVAEMVEKLTLGVASTYSFGGGTVYGMANFTNRLTRTLTDPTSSGWTAATTLDEVLAMKQQSQDAYHFGPWMLYVATAWDRYIDNDMSTSYPNKTLRMRLREIDGIQDVRTADFLSDYDMVLVELNPEVIRIVIGLDITTVQWDSEGGLRKNFKVMTIMVPQVRADINDNTGIVHGSV